MTLDKIIKSFINGDVNILPTETVYGFFADADNNHSIEKIYKIKKRSTDKKMAILIPFEHVIFKYLLFEQKKLNNLLIDFDNSVTFILPFVNNKIIKNHLSPYTYFEDGNLIKIAIRFTSSEWLKNIIYNHKKPLMATSVNISNEDCIMDYYEIKKRFSSDPINMFISGKEVGVNLSKKPSSIHEIDLLGNILTKIR